MGKFEAGMESMVDMYIFETTTLLEQLDQILMRTEAKKNFDEEDINEIFRIMHTIKGSSAMMGLDNMAKLAHSLEDMFFIIREEKPKMTSVESLYELVFLASDLLKAEIEIVQNDDYQNTDFSSEIAKITNYVVVLKKGEVAHVDSGMHESQEKTLINVDQDMITIRVFFEDDCGMENLRALLLVNKLKHNCSKIIYKPENIENDSSTAKEIIENGFVISFKTDKSESVIFTEIEEALNVKSFEKITQKVKEVDNNVEKPIKQEETVAAKQELPIIQTEEVKKINDTVSQANKGKQSLISVNLNKLDQLLDMVGEIVITEAMVTSSPDLKDLKLDNFQKAARQLRKLTDELQDIVMSIRMVPLSGAFNKMTRIIRDMKVKLNKDVNLVFEGEETEVDKSIIDNLNDPLMHMVRNSMDHGIEDDPQERIEKGKPEKGTITLSAYNASGEVIIVVSDDGKGINTKKVLEKAVKNKLLTKSPSEYSDKEIFNMIMLPGFSTNEQVTEFSGRGVGMDVVRKNIEKIGGSVSVDSKFGQGTKFIVKIPLSLAIVDGIEISVGKSIFTIPINTVRESIKIEKKQLIKDTAGKEMIKIRGECFPLVRLYEYFDIEPVSKSAFDGMIIVVETEGKMVCLLADELLGEQQVVVKPFSPLLNKYNVKQNGMAGCTILGDGSITIILDVSGIISNF